MLRIRLTSVMVDDQAKAQAFYVGKLGFVVRQDFEVGGGFRWLTLSEAEAGNPVELLLEPMAGSAAAPVFQKALYEAGIPATAFGVDDLAAEYARLSAAGVVFQAPPTTPETGPATAALDDTCGNWIQLFQL